MYILGIIFWRDSFSTDPQLNLSIFFVAHFHNSILTSGKVSRNRESLFPPSQHNSWDEGKFMFAENTIPLHYCLVIFDDIDANLTHSLIAFSQQTLKEIGWFKSVSRMLKYAIRKYKTLWVIVICCLTFNWQSISLALFTIAKTSTLLFKVSLNKSILCDNQSSTDSSFQGLNRIVASGLVK